MEHDVANRSDEWVLLGLQGLGRITPDGRLYQVERVEVGVELAPDTFTLQPSTESGRGK